MSEYKGWLIEVALSVPTGAHAAIRIDIQKNIFPAFFDQSRSAAALFALEWLRKIRDIRSPSSLSATLKSSSDGRCFAIGDIRQPHARSSDIFATLFWRQSRPH